MFFNYSNDKKINILNEIKNLDEYETFESINSFLLEHLKIK